MSGILPDHSDAFSLRASNGPSFGYAPNGNDAVDAWNSLLLLGAASTEAFRHQLAMLDIETQRRIALHPSHCSANQPRTPASSTETESQPPATPEVPPDTNQASAPDNPP